MARDGLMKDARLRGNFNKWLDRQSVARYNTPGLDYNRARQGINAGEGRKNFQQRPRQATGDMYQNFFRNRSNEQAGMPRPAKPATAHAPIGPRRTS